MAATMMRMITKRGARGRAEPEGIGGAGGAAAGAADLVRNRAPADNLGEAGPVAATFASEAATESLAAAPLGAPRDGKVAVAELGRERRLADAGLTDADFLRRIECSLEIVLNVRIEQSWTPAQSNRNEKNKSQMFKLTFVQNDPFLGFKTISGSRNE